MFIGTVPDAAQIFAPLFGRLSEERVVVPHLTRERRMLALTLEELSGEDGVELPVRRILSNALRLGSHGIVVAHNHPSGDPTPSPSDDAATWALASAAAEVEVRLYDHIIFAGEKSSSFLALGLL